MSFTAGFDIASFGLGFAVAPVAYFVFGAVVYSVFCTAKWLTMPFRQRWKLSYQPRQRSRKRIHPIVSPT
jgi:hypothetical protein